MLRDEHGLTMTAASPEVVEAYDRSVRALLHYGPEMLSAPEDAFAADPTCPLVNLLRAYLCLMSTEYRHLASGRAMVEDFRARVERDSLLPRERAHLAAAEALAAEDMLTASRILRGITREHPRDALALHVGHNFDYFTGDAGSLRDRIAEALPAWSQDDPLYGTVLGMYSFGLEEAGEYAQSEEVGREALAVDPKDVWAMHSVVHNLEMQARFGEGVRFFESRMDHWADGNYFKVHNWWHYGLYQLEVGNLARVREVYDQQIFFEAARDVAVKMCDASALLWRLLLEGVDETARWRELAEVWERLADEPCYAFNDMHAVMAFVGAGEMARAEAFVADRERFVAEQHPSVTNWSMTTHVGLPVCRAVVAFGQGRYGVAVDELLPIRHRLYEFGGSHAQRDAVLRTLLEAALRARRLDVAELVLGERISVKPGSPYNWLKRGELYRAEDDEPAAEDAERRAEALVRASGLAAAA